MNTDNIVWENLPPDAAGESYTDATAPSETIDFIGDVMECVRSLRVRGEEPSMIYMPEMTFRLLRDKLPMKGNAKWRKAIRWRNRKRKPIRNYVSSDHYFQMDVIPASISLTTGVCAS